MLQVEEMDYNFDNLSDEQREQYDTLLQQAKELYPTYDEIILQPPILYYILSNFDDDCFTKLEEENKSAGIVDTDYKYEQSI